MMSPIPNGMEIAVILLFTSGLHILTFENHFILYSFNFCYSENINRICHMNCYDMFSLVIDISFI